MKMIKRKSIGIRPVFSTNVENNFNYVSQGGIVNKNCVVDEGYEGEVHLNLINPTSETQSIEWDSKIIQFIQLKIDQHQPTEITDEEYLSLCKRENGNSTRGAGGFGSTGVV